MEHQAWGLRLDLPDSFGDSGSQWTEGRAIVWKALQMGAVIEPPAEIGEGQPNTGWWLGLADLLCFGAGVTDLAAFLRQPNFAQSSKLKKFIESNWGDTSALLELYLSLHPQVRQAVSVYLNHCRGHNSAEVEDFEETEEDVFLTASYAKASIATERDERLARALFLNREEILVENLRDRQDGDPAHFVPHFTFLWSETSNELEPRDYIEFGRNASAVLHLSSYAGWYAKLHHVRLEFEKDLDYAVEFNRVEVSVSGIGPLGTFIFDKIRGCFVLEYEEITTGVYEDSPRFGFKLDAEMCEIFSGLAESFDLERSDYVERVELQIRSEVDLAHSLTYEIQGEDGEEFDWTRIDGEWRRGFMIPDGVHHKRCTKALIESNELSSSMPWHQAVLDGSVVHEVAPWAYELVVGLWDSGKPVRSVVGLLASLPPHDDVSMDACDSELGELIANYVDSLRAFIPPDSDFLIEELLEWQQGRYLDAEDLLKAIVEAESHR